MKLKKLVTLLTLAVLMTISTSVSARLVHDFECNLCHKWGATTDSLSSNVCLDCHVSGQSGASFPLYRSTGNTNTVDTAIFQMGDASNAVGSNPSPSAENSHFWAGSDTNPAAGAQAPVDPAFYGNHNYSGATATCARCHEPHDLMTDDNGPGTANPKLLKLGATGEAAMCTDCHRAWDVANVNALETHPLNITYSDFSGDSVRFKPSVDNTLTTSGDIQLVNGKVTCVTCHGVHYTDSDGSTADGRGLSLSPGDGKMLRSDGALTTGPQRNLADGTAQRRSNLCQACHTYQLHGKGVSGDHQIGCLECHGGHSHNGGNPSDFVLRTSNSSVPTRIDGTNGGPAAVTFPVYTAGGSSRTTWSDDTNGTANGYCEQCHGDVQDPANIGNSASEHLAGDPNECSGCHKHNGTGWTMSFQVDASAASCGACHGFPPYLNLAGNRGSGGTDGGYAFNDVDAPNYNYLDDSGHFKDETTTAHKTHAGANLSANPGEWYFVGSAGIENCQVCHGDAAGTTPGSHRVPPTTDSETFRHVPFNALSTANGNLAPSYNVSTFVCSNVYCHTNGTPRTGDATHDYTGTADSPAWVGTGFAGDGNGFTAIQSDPNRCSHCHGNDSATMTTKANSPRHNKHLGAPYNYDCTVCHNSTASSATALQTGATDGETGGTHINSTADVSFDATALGGALSGENYDSQGAGTGTCSVYCHDPSNSGKFADWDSAVALTCASCHDGRVGDASVIATGSHTKHVSDTSGPQLACADCHGTNADSGTHTGHVDGTPTVTAGVCDTCHGYDVGETQPTWGVAPTADEYCITCHTGATRSAFSTYSAPVSVVNAASTGHNKPSATYGSGNVAAADQCTSCHDTSVGGHFDGASDSLAKVNVEGFPSTYAGNEDAFCGACHDAAPVNPSPSTKTGLNTHQSKTCVTCHNPHGDGTDTSNIYMVKSSSADYSGVAFYATTGADSYDEDDGAVGGAGEVNADDICATCHTVAGGTGHNNADNSTGDHHQGEDCFTCHAPHTDATPFAAQAGTACNDCHGFPPATGAHGDGTNLHTRVASNDKDIEDRTDCAVCHTGADSFTYDPAADQVATLNHSNATGRVTLLTASVGYNDADKSCASACHVSSAADGTWDDATGLNCTACHYYDPAPTSGANAGNPSPLTSSHDGHFDAGKLCSDCHSIENAGNPVAGGLTHITDQSGADEAAVITGMATALPSEATVTRTSMTWTSPTCSGGGIALGCHATGSPNWGSGPQTCTLCHTDTTTSTVNPTSGLHGGTLTVTSNNHDGSYDDGNLGTADCTTCHTTTPSSAHIDGTFDATIGAGGNTKINFAAAVNYTDAVVPTCAPGTGLTTCHSDGGVWSRKWNTTARNSDGTECANCHGVWGSWSIGVTHRSNAQPQTTHGTGTYQCKDCHSIQSASGYTFTSGSADWAGVPVSEITNHGDDKITLNNDGTGFSRGTGGDTGLSGCNGCHADFDGIADGSHSFTTTSWTLDTVAGDPIIQSCATCHGGGTAGPSANNFWPDGVDLQDDVNKNNGGEHAAHIIQLANTVYPLDIGGNDAATIQNLLTDNTANYAALTSEDKQKELCSYCHTNPGVNPGHSDSALPAEENGMFNLWDKGADAATYDNATDSCSSVNCHNNKTTPAANDWYGGSSYSCSICHLDVITDNTHTDHTGASTTFGITIGCAQCHQAATNWGTNTPPASGHINGTFSVDGGTVIDGTTNTYSGFTYPGVKGSCGTNDCHQNGKGAAPNIATYNWDTSQPDCTLCHDNPNSSGNDGARHTTHVGSALGISCNDCHTAETAATHINSTVNVGGTSNVNYAGAPGCTNNCHLVDTARGDWTDVDVLTCTDCHSSTFVGSGTNMPQYNMHVVTPTVSGQVHNDSLTACATCHTSITAQGTHINGVWSADDADNTNDQNRGLFATYTDAAGGGSCSGAGVSCHADGGNWTRKWKATAANSDGSECANCHGDWTNGWNAGVTHRTDAQPQATHGSGTTYECKDCHGLEAAAGYAFTSGSQDWNAAAGETSNHGDGNITINSNGTSFARGTGGDAGLSGCSACHLPFDGTTSGQHSFTTTSWPLDTVVADALAAGCTSCHGGSGQYWPVSTATPDNTLGDTTSPNGVGKHAQHMTALATKVYGEVLDSNVTNGLLADNTTANSGITSDTKQRTLCEYCHAANPRDGLHGTSYPARVFVDSDTVRHANNLWGAPDSDATYDTGNGTCNTVNCHFNKDVTPHWYADTTAPAVATLTAVPGPNPRSIKVSWNAPGDDANMANTTAYVYDMRYSTSSGTGTDAASDYTSTSNYVGGLPAAYIQGAATEVVVENLTPATTYYFSLKTRDTAGNWSTVSGEKSATPTVDTIAPEFGGADKALKGDEGESINLYWTAAEDNSMPITYKIWLKDEAAGTLDLDVDSPIITGWPDTQIELGAADGLVDDQIYHMGVRACDALAQCDTNIQTVSATPTAVPLVPKSYHTYATNGSATLVKDGSSGTPVTGISLPVVFAGSNLSYDVTYFVDTFAVYVDMGNTAGLIRATLGYSTNGTNFTSLGLYKDVMGSSRGDRVFQFKFVDTAGKPIHSGESLAIEISDQGGTGAVLDYGDSTSRGDVTVAERVVNVPPAAATDNATALTGAIVNINWNAATDAVDGLADVVHYDLYGSNDGGISYDHAIVEGLDAATLSYVWDTQTAGITGGSIAVRINAGDGYSHTSTNITGLGTADANDYVPPSAVTDLSIQERPKAGSAWLTWTAPGDDYDNHGRAAYYDVRYSTSPINNDTDFNNATQAIAEPSPMFGGEVQHMEVVDLVPGTNYYFALKTFDEAGNSSPLSSAKSAGSDQVVGGPRCGMCHTTAPSVTASVGNHKLHGFTIDRCDKCHNDGTTPPSTYGLDHQDGTLKMGFGPGGAHQGNISGNRIYYTDDGTPGGTILYDDTTGFGGFGDGTYTTTGDATDNGSCFNWGALGVGGCHGPAGSDPDAGGPLPTYPTPNWTDTATLVCSSCHGNPSRTVDRYYSRDFDGTVDNLGVVPDQIKGAPEVDNHGNLDNPAEPSEAKRKYVGQHEKHLNYSFRFAKGDSCNLCHAGNYTDKNNLSGRHANGEVDIHLDPTAAGDNATWLPGTATTAGSCSNLSDLSCHPKDVLSGGTAPTPKWDDAMTFECVQCHGMGGTTPSHTVDPNGGVSTVDNGWATDPRPGNCTYCHFGGHPTDAAVSGTAVVLSNSSQVGINYRSGGIHLKKTIGGNGTFNTEAELCWGCHDNNGISEWGADDNPYARTINTATAPDNGSDYNYGTLSTSNWTTATWTSGSAPQFAYKTGAIQSTHTTNEAGSAAVTGSMGAYSESPDAVGLIRCSNCHDVHDLAKAPGDKALGAPYLRGTWIRNPYPEDGAPWNKTYTVTNSNYDAVPRAGGPGGNEQGGYQIDQNNGSPTAGLSLATSAGICTLCHGTDVDNLDKTPSESLWIGTNGHSNAALGGTASNASNIFGWGIGGRPTPTASSGDGTLDAADVETMGMQVPELIANDEYGYGYRGGVSGPGYTPNVANRGKAYYDFFWGVSVDAGTIDVGYHAFTCSKCHNPHASRLPKLMITNCLDTSHNTWDENQGSTQTYWTSPTDNGETSATHDTAQNCHRYDPNDGVGGWNKVTPW